MSFGGSDSDDAADCPLCCAELDLTDRSIQYCGCGCEQSSHPSAARTQRDDLMALAGQMQELAEFLKVFFASCLSISTILFF